MLLKFYFSCCDEALQLEPEAVCPAEISAFRSHAEYKKGLFSEQSEEMCFIF